MAYQYGVRVVERQHGGLARGVCKRLVVSLEDKAVEGFSRREAERSPDGVKRGVGAVHWVVGVLDGGGGPGSRRRGRAWCHESEDGGERKRGVWAKRPKARSFKGL